MSSTFNALLRRKVFIEGTRIRTYFYMWVVFVVGFRLAQRVFSNLVPRVAHLTASLAPDSKMRVPGNEVGFSLGSPVLLHNNHNISKFQFDHDKWPTWKKQLSKADVASSLNIVISFLFLFTLSLFHLFIDAFTMIRVWRISSNILVKEEKKISRLRFRCSNLNLFVKWRQCSNFTWKVCLFLRWISQTRRRLERHECYLQVSKNRKKVENKCRSITINDKYVSSLVNSVDYLTIIP